MNQFVNYLNSLHSYNAQNSNAYSEKNITNEFYEKIAVKISLGDHIFNELNKDDPQMIILTGHAGDGKTGIMNQVIKQCGTVFNTKDKFTDIILPNGKTCRCIKDFSELSDEEKTNQITEVIDYPKQGKSVFMISNTGPLLNAFEKSAFGSEETASVSKLIEAMQKNDGNTVDINGHKLKIIDVANIDNTDFATELLENFLKDELWTECSACDKKAYCPILRNIKLLKKHKSQSLDFISNHYIWLYEYGHRLTIRSITEQLAFMITGGLSCSDATKVKRYKYLYPNLFFGYIDGFDFDKKAKSIIAINISNDCSYDEKRLQSDERLFVTENYSGVFDNAEDDVISIIREAENSKAALKDGNLRKLVHRLYFFMNINTDDVIKNKDMEDIFSAKFEKYLSFRNGTSKPAYHDFDYVGEALSMIYTGVTKKKEKEIPLTLSRGDGSNQNVQIIIGKIDSQKIQVDLLPSNSELCFSNKKRNTLRLKYNSEPIGCELTLPLINYFDELRKGIISTNIDPQLSHGIENLRAKLSKLCSEKDNPDLKIVILKNSGNENYELSFENDEIKLN